MAESDYVAFCDESMRVRKGDDGIYVLAAAIFEDSQLDDTRDLLRRLGRPRPRFHWKERSLRDRLKAVETVVSVPALHVAVVNTSMMPTKQERARAQCLEQLLWQLERDHVFDVALENRTSSLNRVDLATVAGLRRRQVISAGGVLVRHVHPSEEPLLWAADIVAGAVRETHDGIEIYADLLGEVVVEITIENG